VNDFDISEALFTNSNLNEKGHLII